MKTKHFSYKKGERPHLDEVYDILGIIPSDTYFQHDFCDEDARDNNPDFDSGESILFLKDVTITITIEVG